MKLQEYWQGSFEFFYTHLCRNTRGWGTTIFRSVHDLILVFFMHIAGSMRY